MNRTVWTIEAAAGKKTTTTATTTKQKFELGKDMKMQIKSRMMNNNNNNNEFEKKKHRGNKQTNKYKNK